MKQVPIVKDHIIKDHIFFFHKKPGRRGAGTVMIMMTMMTAEWWSLVIDQV